MVGAVLGPASASLVERAALGALFLGWGIAIWWNTFGGSGGMSQWC